MIVNKGNWNMKIENCLNCKYYVLKGIEFYICEIGDGKIRSCEPDCHFKEIEIIHFKKGEYQ